MLDLDALIAEAELETGTAPALVAARSPEVRVSRVVKVAGGGHSAWTETEELFLAENIGFLSEADLAAALGRSLAAIKIRRYRHLEVAGPSVNDAFMSAHRVAEALGVDGHTAVKVVDRGILPTWRYSRREMRLIRRVTFLRWATNPLHWCYFGRSVRDTSRLGDAHLRRLIERRQRRWNDEWWSIGEVAAFHNVDHTDVNRYAHAGKIRGVKFGNWWFLRSEATRPGLVFHKGKGAAQAYARQWSEAADCFILIGTALGVKQAALAALMGWPGKTVSSRWAALRKNGQIPALIARYGLKLHYDAPTGQVDGSWADFGYKFPRLKLTDTRSTKGAARLRR